MSFLKQSLDNIKVWINEKIEQGLIDGADDLAKEDEMFNGINDDDNGDTAETQYETVSPEKEKKQASESWLIY